MKICVIINSFGAVIHVGGSIETFVREFEVSPEFAEYVEAQRKIGDCTISLAFMEDKNKAVSASTLGANHGSKVNGI